MRRVEVERLVEAALGAIGVAERLVEHAHQEEQFGRRRERRAGAFAEFEGLEMPPRIGQPARLLEDVLERRRRGLGTRAGAASGGGPRAEAEARSREVPRGLSGPWGFC